MQTSQSFIQIPNNPIRLLEYHCQSGITQVEFHDNYNVQGSEQYRLHRLYLYIIFVTPHSAPNIIVFELISPISCMS